MPEPVLEKPASPTLLRAAWPFAAVLLTAAAVPFGFGVSSAFLVGGAVVVLHRQALTIRGMSRFVMAAAAGLLIAGIVLWALNTDSPAPNSASALYALIFLFTQALSFVVLVWAAGRIGVPALLVANGIGSYMNLIVLYRIPFDNFKFAIAIPAALIVAGVLHRRPGALTVGFLALGVIGMASGARSFAAFITAALILWFFARRMPPARVDARPIGRYLLTGIVGLVLGVGIYEAGTQLLLSGAFGSSNQSRTATQLEQTGNLITSARPEWFATFGLMHHHIWGYGPGAAPDSNTLMAALTSLGTIHFEGGDYVTGFMFGGHYELHSVIADLWVTFGLVGLVVGVALLAYMVFVLLDEIVGGRPRLIVMFLLLNSAWYLLFGPLSSNAPFVVLTLAVVAALPRRGEDHHVDDSAGAEPSTSPTMSGRHRASV